MIAHRDDPRRLLVSADRSDRVARNDRVTRYSTSIRTLEIVDVWGARCCYLDNDVVVAGPTDGCRTVRHVHLDAASQPRRGQVAPPDVAYTARRSQVLAGSAHADDNMWLCGPDRRPATPTSNAVGEIMPGELFTKHGPGSSAKPNGTSLPRVRDWAFVPRCAGGSLRPWWRMIRGRMGKLRDGASRQRRTGVGSVRAADSPRRAWLATGGGAAVGAGVAGVLGLLSVIPWPELFSLDANPGNAVVMDPGLQVVLVGHYMILVAGGALGLVAAVILVVALRGWATVRIGALMLAGGSAAFTYAAAVRAIDLTVNDGRASEDVEVVVWGGGAVLLVGVVALTLALRRQGGKGFLLLGLGAPLLVAAGIATFVLVGPDFYPEIWGVTFPPPTDYLLAIWFIGLGRVMRTKLQQRPGPAVV